MNPLVEILIPTFNRKAYILDNLNVLSRLVMEEQLGSSVRVLISDNCSNDGTAEAVSVLRDTLDFELKIYSQSENTGPERNVIFLLSKATAKFVMYLGDDDFLPAGYLTYVINKIKEDPAVGTIIPGFSSLYVNGDIKPARTAEFFDKKFVASFQAVLALSNYGHQMSGLVFRCESLLSKYTAEAHLRNLYPFIYFLSFNALNGNSYYAPGFQVLVTQGNVKAWSYDDLGLLPDIFKNYRILFPGSVLLRIRCCLSFTRFQPWRLSTDRSIGITTRSFLRFILSPQIEFAVKIVYLPIYLTSILNLILDKLGRILHN